MWQVSSKEIVKCRKQEDEMNYEEFIINKITMLSGKYTPYQIFSDWITMMAVSIQNSCKIIHDKIYKEREDMYVAIAKRYSTDELKTLADMGGALAIVLGERFGDILGEIYMKSGCGNENTGQFFTPYHLSYLTAKLCYEDKFDQTGDIYVNEPSTGGGGMMIAICHVAKERGFDYQRRLHIVAQDLDWNGVYMTYIQLSLLGVKAIVVQGDTLNEPYHNGYDEERIFRTPSEMGLII